MLCPYAKTDNKNLFSARCHAQATNNKIKLEASKVKMMKKDLNKTYPNKMRVRRTIASKQSPQSNFVMLVRLILVVLRASELVN